MKKTLIALLLLTAMLLTAVSCGSGAEPKTTQAAESTAASESGLQESAAFSALFPDCDGSIFGLDILGASYQPMLLAVLASGGFLTFGLMLGVFNAVMNKLRLKRIREEAR